MKVYVMIKELVDSVEVEIFSGRPKTDNDPSNWPRNFEVYVGNVDGGDSRLIEQRVAGRLTMKGNEY